MSDEKDNEEEGYRDQIEWAQLPMRVPAEEKEEWRERMHTMSGDIKGIVRTWLEYEDEHGVQEDMDDLELVMLRTYRNAIEKNIQLLQQQKEEFDEEIERLEEERGGEVLMEINIDLEEETL